MQGTYGEPLASIMRIETRINRAERYLAANCNENLIGAVQMKAAV